MGLFPKLSPQHGVRPSESLAPHTYLQEEDGKGQLVALEACTSLSRRVPLSIASTG